MPKPVLRSDVIDMKDLRPGMKLKGTVRNVIDFGAFVDIGVHEDGLVHISRMANRYIKHPLEVVSVGDVVDVTVLEVDEKKGRISLSMVDDAPTAKKPAPGNRKGTGTNKADIRTRSGKPKQADSDTDFAPGTIGYILAHSKKPGRRG